jgi:threonine dehydrogenase-like Zn-dependent dehydrogenase
MHAAVYHERGALALEQRPLPSLGDEDVLVQVAACGVCGSDLHSVLEGWGVPGSVEGHEYAGEVVAVGPAVQRWQVGDRVVGGGARGCGRCPACLAGRRPLCAERGEIGAEPMQGAFAGFTARHQEELVRVPDGLSLRAAALAEPLTVALHGITLARVDPEHRVVVFGCGPIGALTVAALGASGQAHVTVVEPSASRQALARELGAHDVVAPEDLPTPGWHPRHVVPEPFERAIECSGARPAMEAALGQLAPLGRLVLVGSGVDAPRFDPNRILLNELEITGAFTYDEGGFEHALGLLGSGALPTDRLLEPGGVPLDGLLDAMQRLAAGELAGKVLVTP